MRPFIKEQKANILSVLHVITLYLKVSDFLQIFFCVQTLTTYMMVTVNHSVIRLRMDMPFIKEQKVNIHSVLHVI